MSEPNELEACVEIIIENSLSTGHAESHLELMKEVMWQVRKMQERLLAVKSPWVSVDEFEDIPLGEWLVKFKGKVDPEKIENIICRRRKKADTIGTYFAFDRLEYIQPIAYMPIPPLPEEQT